MRTPSRERREELELFFGKPDFFSSLLALEPMQSS
jgi:hypothetical protein